MVQQNKEIIISKKKIDKTVTNAKNLLKMVFSKLFDIASWQINAQL